MISIPLKHHFKKKKKKKKKRKGIILKWNKRKQKSKYNYKTRLNQCKKKRIGR